MLLLLFFFLFFRVYYNGLQHAAAAQNGVAPYAPCHRRVRGVGQRPPHRRAAAFKRLANLIFHVLAYFYSLHLPSYFFGKVCSPPRHSAQLVNLTPIHTFLVTHITYPVLHGAADRILTNKNPLTYVVAVRDSNPLHVPRPPVLTCTAFTQQHPPALLEYIMSDEKQ